MLKTAVSIWGLVKPILFKAIVAGAVVFFAELAKQVHQKMLPA